MGSTACFARSAARDDRRSVQARLFSRREQRSGLPAGAREGMSAVRLSHIAPRPAAPVMGRSVQCPQRVCALGRVVGPKAVALRTSPRDLRRYESDAIEVARPFASESALWDRGLRAKQLLLRPPSRRANLGPRHSPPWPPPKRCWIRKKPTASWSRPPRPNSKLTGTPSVGTAGTRPNCSTSTMRF